MNKNILYPFRIDTNFQIGYSWSVELTRRLKGKISLFTTKNPNSAEPIADIYHDLAEAHGFYIKNFQLLPLRLKPTKSDRIFSDGNFESTFLELVHQRNPYLIVLQSDTLSAQTIRGVISSGYKVIVLAADEINKIPLTKQDRARLFVGIFRSAACYNIPASVFDTIGQDKSLFNSIAAFFSR